MAAVISISRCPHMHDRRSFARNRCRNRPIRARRSHLDWTVGSAPLCRTGKWPQERLYPDLRHHTARSSMAVRCFVSP